MIRMKVIGIVLFCLLIPVPFAFAPIQQELAYDDGSSEAGKMYQFPAVKFDLPDGWATAKLLSVRFMWSAYPAPSSPSPWYLYIHVYDSDGSTELTPSGGIQFKPYTTSPGWNEKDLSTYNIDVGTQFYVAIEEPSNGVNGNAYLDYQGDASHSYHGGPGSWTQENPGDAYMIRATVEQLSTIPQVPEFSLPAVFMISFAAVVVLMSRRLSLGRT